MPGAAYRFAFDVEQQIEYLRARKGARATPPGIADATDTAVCLVKFDRMTAGALDETLDRHDALIFPRVDANETGCGPGLGRRVMLRKSI
jgi:hypothetical protein